MDRRRAYLSIGLGTVLVCFALGAAGCTRVDSSGNEGRRSSDDVERIVEDRCGGCHSASKALDWKTTDASAAKHLVDTMVDRGAVLTRAERAVLIAYYLR